MVGDKHPITTEINDKDTIIFAISKSAGEQNQSIFNISVNGGTLSYLETIIKDGPEGIMSTWGSNPAENIPIKGEMVLASICYSTAEGGMHSLPDNLYQDAESHMDELQDYDVVYLLKSEFV